MSLRASNFIFFSRSTHLPTVEDNRTKYEADDKDDDNDDGSSCGGVTIATLAVGTVTTLLCSLSTFIFWRLRTTTF